VQKQYAGDDTVCGFNVDDSELATGVGDTVRWSIQVAGHAVPVLPHYTSIFPPSLQIGTREQARQN
jgi:hypothetical protein